MRIDGFWSEGRYMYLFKLWFPLDIHPLVGLLDHVAALFLVFILFFFKFYFIFKLYIIVLVLPNIKMNPIFSF